jgi:hypothetical protein
VTEPVTDTEITDLMRRLQRLHQQHPAHPRQQAAILARKAELLARIADHRADEWGPCDHTTQAREIATEAQAIADNARRLARVGGARSQENPPPF